MTLKRNNDWRWTRDDSWKTCFFFKLTSPLHSGFVKYGIIINQGTPNHLTTKEKILYFLQSPCSVFCLIIERGTYILIMFSCKLTNANDEKLNTGLLNTTGRQMQLNFPKSNSNLRCHCPKKGFTRKQTVFSSWIIFVVVFFFSCSIFCLQYSPPLLMFVILVLLVNHNIFISFCVIWCGVTNLCY